MGQGEADLALFDDMRTCLSQSLEVDLFRVSTTGFSAGALWTTFLTLRRADVLATAMLFSGGTEPAVTYQTPARPLPMFLAWGGPDDTYNGMLSFAETTANLSSELQEDGHFLVHCDHGYGHTVPYGLIGDVPTWLLAHRFGEPSPFESGDLSELASYCVLPEG